MSRPTLYIDHPATLTAQARRGEIPLRGLYCGMAGHTRHGSEGRVSALAPHYADVLDVLAGRLPFDLYARLCLAKWAEARLHPGALVCDPDDGDPFEGIGVNPARILRDGAGLYCECARPGSKSRRHPCHRELLPLVLVPAGWDVVLYGRRVIGAIHLAIEMGWTAQDEGYSPTSAPLYADTGEPYNPAAFGWPNTTETPR